MKSAAESYEVEQIGTMCDHFTPTHHALLFGWIAQAVIERTGAERGEAILRRAVRRYGEERGRRMVLRAQVAGHPLSMASYLAYGEWRAAPEDFERRTFVRAPHLETHVYRCPWHSAWRENGLLPYGRLYCLEIDEALVRGFNPALRLEVNGTLANGAPRCAFVYHDARPPGAPELMVDSARTVKPWEYHIGHLWATVGGVVVEELGALGREALDAALARFAARYGQEAAARMVASAKADFAAV